MNYSQEIQGKTVQDAVEKACEKFQLTRKEIKYDVISNGSSGIFGLVGVKKARIRVMVPKTAKEKTNKTKVDMDGVRSLVDEAFNGTEPVRKKERSSFSKPEREEKVTQTSEPLQEDMRAVEVGEDLIKIGTEALQNIVAKITDEADISVQREKEKIVYNINGGNTSVLIGKRGQNLEAIQYLVDKIVNKNSERRIRILVDVGGYQEKRRENLKRLAAKMATKTKRSGKPATIGPMNAQDRRIVHIALKNDRGVRTQSIGEGYYRKLIIFPKKGNPRRKRQTESVNAAEE